MFEELEVLNTEEAHLEDELCDLNHILEAHQRHSVGTSHDSGTKCYARKQPSSSGQAQHAGKKNSSESGEARNNACLDPGNAHVYRCLLTNNIGLSQKEVEGLFSRGTHIARAGESHDMPCSQRLLDVADGASNVLHGGGNCAVQVLHAREDAGACYSARTNDLDSATSDMIECLHLAEEMLQDRLRVDFKEAVKLILTVLQGEGSVSPGDMEVTDMCMLADDALKPSEATTRSVFQPQGELAISLRCRMMDAVLATRSHLYLEVIKPVMQQGSNLSKGGTVMDVQSSTCSAFPARGEVSYAPVDVVRLEQLEQHVAKLESTLHAAVAELEIGAAYAKRLEASYTSMQVKASSAQQQAVQAKCERDELAKQLAAARQLENALLPVQDEAERLALAEACARRAEARASEAEMRAASLKHEVKVLQLQTQLAVEQLQAVGVNICGKV